MQFFNRTRGGVAFISTNPTDSNAELDGLLALVDQNVAADFMTAEQAEAKRAELRKAHASDDVEEMAVSPDNLKKITDRYTLLSPIVRELRNAQIDMTVELLKEGDLEISTKELKRLTGETPKKIREWADEPAKGFGVKKSNQVREGISSNTIRDLEALLPKAKSS